MCVEWLRRFKVAFYAFCRSLSSKVVSQYSSLMSPMAVEAVLRVMDPQQPQL
jgi:T-complex protein 1 subunit delta